MATRRGVFVAVAAAGCVFAGGSPPAGHAAALEAARPHVISLSVSPLRLPAHGGRVTLRARVSGGATCSFYGQTNADDVVSVVNAAPCARGTARTTVKVDPNSHTRVVKLSFSVLVTDAIGRSSRRAAVIVQAAGPKPPPPPPPAFAVLANALPHAVLSTPYSAALGAADGDAPFTWAVTSGALPAGLSLSPSGVISGTATATGVSAFTVTATDARAKRATARLAIAVVASPPLDLAPLTETSGNWSGYADVGGPYTAATGTFNVPTLTPGTTRAVTAEWIGIDGYSNPDLIQAGVEEDYDPLFGQQLTSAWWEILPAPETTVLSLTVNPGDSVTIDIAEVGPGVWTITIIDNTTGEQFTTTQNYAGDGTSAEWIVEAPTSGDSGSVETLAPYSPNVTFTNLGISGATTLASLLTMRQQHTPVSSPSALSANGFSVAYGPAAPPPP